MSIICGLILQNMTAIEKIRQAIEGEVFDYTQLMDALKEYKKPRDAVSKVLQKNQIIRIRKGLYIYGELWRKREVSIESLACLVYGPSIISLDFALSYYGLIPERVHSITSISIGRSREFTTPVGRFSYKQQNALRFSFAYSIQRNNTGNYLLAEPIKALADKVWADKRFRPTSPFSYGEYLFEDLRIDEALLKQYINTGFLEKLVSVYSSRKILWLEVFLLNYFKK